VTVIFMSLSLGPAPGGAMVSVRTPAGIIGTRLVSFLAASEKSWWTVCRQRKSSTWTAQDALPGWRVTLRCRKGKQVCGRPFVQQCSVL